jgi:hypothetical protein
MNPLTQSKNTTILPLVIALTLGCFGLSPQAQAVCQEGCLTNSNTVLGEDALLNNTGSTNTAIGFAALNSNTIGFANTAIGDGVLFNNTEGFFNTATGSNALISNTTGTYNTANGFFALRNTTTASLNTATGASALQVNTTGAENTATGYGALLNNTTGNNNIALGSGAGTNLTTGSHNIDIGNAGIAGESKTIRVGTQQHKATFVGGISGATVTGTAVVVNSSGQLGVAPSSQRFKQNIQTMGDTSDILLALRPVTFEYKPDVDSKCIPQFGLVAEDVEKVNPDLVARDEQGKPYTVRYEAVNAMLLNEFLKEHSKVEKEAEINRQQQASIARLEAIVKEQAAQIQKVSAQLEVTKPAPQVVNNP